MSLLFTRQAIGCGVEIETTHFSDSDMVMVELQRGIGNARSTGLLGMGETREQAMASLYESINALGAVVAAAQKPRGTAA